MGSARNAGDDAANYFGLDGSGGPEEPPPRRTTLRVGFAEAPAQDPHGIRGAKRGAQAFRSGQRGGPVCETYHNLEPRGKPRGADGESLWARPDAAHRLLGGGLGFAAPHHPPQRGQPGWKDGLVHPRCRAVLRAGLAMAGGCHRSPEATPFSGRASRFQKRTSKHPSRIPGARETLALSLSFPRAGAECASGTTWASSPTGVAWCPSAPDRRRMSTWSTSRRGASRSSSPGMIGWTCGRRSRN